MAALAQPGDGGVIAFGNGRSYGDQALNTNGRGLTMRRLNRIIDFDPQSGQLICEAGITLREVVDRYLPAGFLPAVSPGTGFVTVGGAVANDVHGKNHERQGSFGNHIQWMDLALPSGQMVRVSPSDNLRLFAATLGGAGLTGIIVRVCLRMQRVPSNAVVLKEERIANLDGFLEQFEAVRKTAMYSVAWIDALASGGNLGRGILETAEYADEGLPEPGGGTRRVPFDLPEFVLNPLSISAFNELYYRRIPRRGRERRVTIPRFLYPLDAISDWNRLYGRRGFFQFQCVLPDETAAAGLRQLLQTIARQRAASFLAVLKTLGADGEGMLSFHTRGYTLALDFPNRAGARDLLARLESITLDHGGRIYLAKDATLSAAGFRRMYPRLKEYQQVLAEIDPGIKMNSDMARRLRIRESAD